MFFIKKDEKKIMKPRFDPDDRVPSWIPSTLEPVSEDTEDLKSKDQRFH